jgi:hypothetical protein
MAVEIVTGRGVYRLSAAGPIEDTDAETVLALAMERADGIERVVILCRIARGLIKEAAESEILIARVGGWLERDFEATRESALKAIRSERRLYEVRFDETNRGPF